MNSPDPRGCSLSLRRLIRALRGRTIVHALHHAAALIHHRAHLSIIFIIAFMSPPIMRPWSDMPGGEGAAAGASWARRAGVPAKTIVAANSASESFM
jgi:hypothetical protein